LILKRTVEESGLTEVAGEVAGEVADEVVGELAGELVGELVCGIKVVAVMIDCYCLC
jgi:hypothetical protein